MVESPWPSRCGRTARQWTLNEVGRWVPCTIFSILTTATGATTREMNGDPWPSESCPGRRDDRRVAGPVRIHKQIAGAL